MPEESVARQGHQPQQCLAALLELVGGDHAPLLAQVDQRKPVAASW